RYESTRDLHRELSALRDHLSEAYSISSSEPVKAAQTPKHYWKWIAIFACLLLIASIFVLLPRTVGVDLSRYSYTAFAMDTAGQFIPRWSPDGKAVAYMGVVKGHDQVFVRYLDSSVSTQLTANREHANLLLGWSSDTKRIIFTAP